MLVIGLISKLLVISLAPQWWNLVLLSRIGMITLFYSLLLLYNCYYPEYLLSGIRLFNGFYQVSTITSLADFFICFLGLLILGITGFHNFSVISREKNKNLWNSPENSLEQIETLESRQCLEYPLVGGFLLLGMQFLVGSLHLISLYLGIELQSFSLYILSSLNRSPLTTRSGLKYFLLGSLSSCFILLGIGIMYSCSGVLSLESLYIFSHYGTENLYWQTGLLIFISGLLFKIAVFPFQNWAVEVYDGVPTLIGTWLTTLTKISILLVLFEWVYHCYGSWTNLLVFLSFFSILLGSFLGFSQVRIKRLIVYSMVSNVGFLLLSLSLCTPQSSESFLFYLIQYSLTNLNIFLILLSMGYSFRIPDSVESPVMEIRTLKGYCSQNPLLSLCFAISLFSLGGIPPLLGFFGKYNVLSALISEGYYFLSLIIVISSVITVAYYLRIIQKIYFEESEKSSESFREITLSSYLSLIISILTLIQVFFILSPEILYTFLRITLLNYFVEF
uniref:NADH-ubiquinone oxidoreductase chain 2 n=1 Tax=Pneumocystis oryctolagi TaxID=42067 RepID=A0A8A6W4M0_9ASCO|nr:NADH dehydrogenase subunit 2 [Pneumocystis oryctolagi]QTK22308.1 NADH dehydrogenase subunit 2 [Pneumocystis oryctolagi]